MPKKSPKPSKQAFDVGRNLPTHPIPEEPINTQELPVSRATKVKRAIVGILVALLVAVLVIASWDGIILSRASAKMFGSGNLFDLLNSSVSTDDNGRVNLLLIGYSVDDPGHPGASLTDSLIVLSFKPGEHKGYMLSIPRDLYVSIPGYGYAKINEAYQDGNRGHFSEASYPAGGPGLLEKVIKQDFNIDVGYYALINYATFRDTVNAVGGISINIKSTDPRGLYDPNISPHDGGPLKLSNGWHILNGQTALNLARARGDSPYSYGFAASDFDRTMHQRQMLNAIKQKSAGFKTLLNPPKFGRLINAVAKNLKTDMSLGEAEGIYSNFRAIPDKDLKSVGLNKIDNGQDLLRSYATPYGQSALIPAAGLDNYQQITAYLSSLNQ